MTQINGWPHFWRTDKPEWKPSAWITWPHAGLSTDMGADCVCGVLALEYKFHCKLTKFPDEAHQKHRALDAALTVCELKPIRIMNVVSLNLKHGPWNDDHRLAEVRDTMQKNVGNGNLEDDVLLNEYSTMVWHELCVYGGCAVPRSQQEEHVRSTVKARSEGEVNKGYQCNFNSFLASFHENNKRMPEWTLNLYERTWVGLEADHMKGIAFKKMVMKSCSVEEDSEEVGSTFLRQRREFLKDMQNACQNGLVCSVMFLQDTTNRDICATIAEIAKTHIALHTEANKEQISPSNAFKWLQAQVGGDFIGHLNKTKDVLVDAGALARLCFPQLRVPFVCLLLFVHLDLIRCGLVLPAGERFSDIDELIGAQDYLADVAGRFTMATILASEVRQVWLLSLPYGLINMLSDVEGVPDHTVAQCRKDYELYKLLVSCENKAAAYLVVIGRSVFQLVIVMQFVHCFIESWWKAFWKKSQTMQWNSDIKLDNAN